MPPVHEIGHAVVGAVLRPRAAIERQDQSMATPAEQAWGQIGTTSFLDKPQLMTHLPPAWPC